MAQVNINIRSGQLTFKYMIDQLLEVRKKVKSDVCLRRLHPDTCKIIRKLRLRR